MEMEMEVVETMSGAEALVERLEARVGELESRLAEAEGALNALKGSSGRKTIAAGAGAMVAKEGSSFDVAGVDAALGSLSVEQRIAVKSGLMRAGLLG